jgi:4-diphosphocytidyl-2-C-methyl-D-erythritol kinase
VEVSTAAVFTQEDLTRNTPPIKIADFLAGRSRNDCQAVTTRLYPEVAKALNWLEKFSPARMTGTGACVFAEFDDPADAQAVLNQVPPAYRAFAARGVNKLEDLSYTLE